MEMLNIPNLDKAFAHSSSETRNTLSDLEGVHSEYFENQSQGIRPGIPIEKLAAEGLQMRLQLLSDKKPGLAEIVIITLNINTIRW